MCELSELTYECGHTTLTFHKSCSTAIHRACMPSISLPDICRKRLKIKEHVSSPSLCKADCSRKEVLDGIAGRHKIAQARIATLAARVAKVSVFVDKVMENYLRVKRFNKLAQGGWDAEKLVELCAASLSSLRTLLSNFPTMQMEAYANLDTAYATAKKVGYGPQRDDGGEGGA